MKTELMLMAGTLFLIIFVIIYLLSNKSTEDFGSTGYWHRRALINTSKLNSSKYNEDINPPFKTGKKWPKFGVQTGMIQSGVGDKESFTNFSGISAYDPNNFVISEYDISKEIAVKPDTFTLEADQDSFLIPELYFEETPHAFGSAEEVDKYDSGSGNIETLKKEFTDINTDQYYNNLKFIHSRASNRSKASVDRIEQAARFNE